MDSLKGLIRKCMDEVWNHQSREDEPQSPGELQDRTLRVMVVDDNDVNLRVAAAFLKKLGHSVQLATDGYAAVESARIEVFDAVFMDCHMPLMDGYETTRQIRRLGHPHGSIPIIAMTAADGAARPICLAAGMNDFLGKPVTREQLANLLRRWCRA